MTKNQLISSLLLIIMICSAISSHAQQRSCSTMDVLEQQLESNPNLAKEIQTIENHTQRVIQNTNGKYQRIADVITIPVVVHIIYQTNEQNISEAQVLSQLQVLNDDFRRKNANADNIWPQAADTEIEFCLANVDPNGNLTTGITRKFFNRDEWGTDNEMKYAANGGVDAWPVTEYLNIWVAYLGRALLGYAQFPGGDAATDGIVMSPQYFGTIGTAQAPYDGGRTATHEIGHWLNLRHIWGDGDCTADDFVSDTPLSDNQNYGCNIGHVSCNTVDMVQNYMDYSDDDCMNLFTIGQKDRMRAVFDVGGFRASLLNSTACSGVAASCNDGIQNQGEMGIDCGGPCSDCTFSCTNVNVNITFDNYPGDVSWVINNSGGLTVAYGGNYGDEPPGSTLSLTECLPNGCYFFSVYDSFGDGLCCDEGNGSYSVTLGNSTFVSGSNFNDLETQDFCLTSTTPTCNDGIQNQGETGIDCGGPCASCPPSSCSQVTLSITFDDYPKDTSWEITNDSGSTVASGNNYDNEPGGSTLTVTECLPSGCYDFTIFDSFGDGLCCRYGNGSYSLIGEGSTLASGSSFEDSETNNFCLSSATPTCNDGIQNQGETDVDCGGPCAPCPPSGCSQVTLSITFDDYPKDTSWEITNSAGSTVASGDNYNNEPGGSTLSVTECLPRDCYDFTIYDSFGDGLCCRYGNGSYSLIGEGSTLASGSSFEDSESNNFCLSTTTPSCSGTEVTFRVTFDDYPKDTSWEITNSAGSTIVSGDNYSNEPGGSTLTVTECLPSGCYDFTIYDSFGDGICCRYGNGSYSLTGGGSTLASGSSFDDSESTNFCLSAATSTSNKNQGENSNKFSTQNSVSVKDKFELSDASYIKVYPNPAIKQATIELNLTHTATNIKLNIVDITGKMVYTKTVEPNNQKQVLNVNVETLASGVYMINLVSDQQQFTQKLTVLD